MAADKVEDINDNVSRLIQRQLMLLDFQEQENEWGLRTWPTVPGISMDKSKRLFAILERWGWIAGSPYPSNNFKCIVTSQGVERLTKIKAGQPLMGATDLTFVGDEHEILCKAALRPRFADGEAHKRDIVSRISHYPTSRPGLWIMLCMGIVLIMIGIHLSISEGITIKSWGTLLGTLGAILAVGSLRVGFRNIEQRYTALSWLPVGIALLLFIPIAWSLFNDTLGHWFAAYLSAGVTLAGIPRPGLIRRLSLGSGS